ncbi:hypothetical protein AAFC00_003064 [Neodothiora populina]|uniref:Acyl-CoA thioesterase II n=1 Tax=Neodothiora populina TaxID=2781224 RepID=A0ABR3P9J6_9PEZI
MATLIRPPPPDPSQSIIESVLELTHLNDIDPNLFTNTRPLWHPPGARGIYGGCVIAQTLAAAQRTVPDNFTIHSMHCYFVLAGNAEIPIIYHVERVRDGKSFITRTVQARQKGKPIFTTTMSFVREKSGGQQVVEHAMDMPAVPGPMQQADVDDIPHGDDSPFVSQRVDMLNHDSHRPQDKKTRQWSRARDTISEAGGHQAHLSALAYMSDSWFIGTVSRVHRLKRYQMSGSARPDEEVVRRLRAMDDETLRRVPGMDEDVIELIRTMSDDEVHNVHNRRPEIGMMVSLDHTIYFHNPRDFRADDWMLSEMESPWAGDGRGLVTQRIFTKDGTLIATCVQEGVVRLKQIPSKL